MSDIMIFLKKLDEFEQSCVPVPVEQSAEKEQFFERNQVVNRTCTAYK